MRRLLLLALLVATPADAQTFVDRSADMPVEHVYAGGWEHFVGGGVATFDCNQDGYPDLAAAGGTNPMRLFVNTRSSAVAFKAADLPAIEGATGVYPIDIDSDGHVDLFVLRVGQNRVLRGGQECSFTDVTDTWGLAGRDRWSTAFSATWEPGQDWPTLAVGNYVDRSNPDGPFEACDVNEVWRHDGTGYRRQDLKPGYCALSVLFSDWSRRGLADLRISNDRHYYVRNGHEQMFKMPTLAELNADDGWVPISIWGMGIASQDITGDQRPDLVLTSMGDQLMQLSRPAGFKAAPFSIGTYAQRPFIGDDGRPSTGWHAEFGDVNNDGLFDLFIAKGNVDQMPGNAMHDPNNMLIQRPDGTFKETADKFGLATTARSRGASLVDFNQDGRLDLVVANRRARLEVYRNDLAAGNWIAIDPRQSGSNPLAIGAWIELRRDTGITTVERTIGGGHAGGKLVPVHLGLGAATDATVRVLWPDGSTGPWKTLAASQTHQIWKD